VKISRGESSVRVGKENGFLQNSERQPLSELWGKPPKLGENLKKGELGGSRIVQEKAGCHRQKGKPRKLLASKQEGKPAQKSHKGKLQTGVARKRSLKKKKGRANICSAEKNVNYKTSKERPRIFLMKKERHATH